jgi:hypothetical protein
MFLEITLQQARREVYLTKDPILVTISKWVDICISDAKRTGQLQIFARKG